MIWLNGSLAARDRVFIDPWDRGFLLGDGLFETLSAKDGVPFRLADHLHRLSEGAEALAIPLPFDVPAIAGAIPSVIGANGLSRTLAAVRVTLSRGPGARGVLPPADPSPTLLISAVEHRGLTFGEGMSATIISRFRRNEGSQLSRLKSLCYLENVLALAQAARAGFDEALMMNNAGAIVCASRANLFLRLSDRLVTPPVSDGILPGITRGLAIETARALGHPVEEASIDGAVIAEAREAFITNSLIGIVPLRRIDARQFQEGDLTRALRAAYRDLIG